MYIFKAAIERLANRVEENLVWKLISYIFQLYECYEIKFHTKISAFTVYGICVCVCVCFSLV